MFLSFKPIYVPKIEVRYSSINEILTIKEDWNLIGREKILAITWEPDFSQTCSFRRILMNHKNFCFTQIPDKHNNMIFLKSPKLLFLDHFWPFLVIFAQWRFFFKKLGSVTHNYIHNPLHTCCETDGWSSMILFDLLKKLGPVSIPNYSITALRANKKIKDRSSSVKNIWTLKVLSEIITRT